MHDGLLPFGAVPSGKPHGTPSVNYFGVTLKTYDQELLDFQPERVGGVEESIVSKVGMDALPTRKDP